MYIVILASFFLPPLEFPGPNSRYTAIPLSYSYIGIVLFKTQSTEEYSDRN